MYASSTPLKLQRDPLPFLVLETQERVDSSALGTPGKTLQFSPRSEFMPQQINQPNQILDAFRDFYSEVDPWGSSVVWLGIVITVLKKNYEEHAPAHWRGEARAGDAGVINELISSLPPDELHAQLLHAGEVMNRLATKAWLEDRDYPMSRPHSSDPSIDEETIDA